MNDTAHVDNLCAIEKIPGRKSTRLNVNGSMVEVEIGTRGRYDTVFNKLGSSLGSVPFSPKVMGQNFLFQSNMIRLDNRTAQRFTHTHSAMSSAAAPLPEGLFFDLVSAEEVEAVHLLEIQGKPTLVLIYVLYVTVHSLGFSTDEAATLEQLLYDYDTMYIHDT